MQRPSWLNNQYLSNFLKFYIAVIPDLIRDLYQYGMFFLLAIIPIIPAFSQSPNETIKIGFLIRDKNDIAIQQTAQMAIEYANAQGGYKSKNFELITKSCDGPWGITSKQTVALIFEDQVPIVVTALDGRNAHLAEQVTAKSHVVMLSTLSSDPTLSRAYVPWYFRMVPDDRQQARLLVQEIYQKSKAQKVAIISFDDYDGKKSAEAFIAQAKTSGYQEPEIIDVALNSELLKKSTENSWDALVLAGSSSDANQIMSGLKPTQLYAFLNFYNFLGADQIKNSGIKTTFYSWETDALWTDFQQLYKAKYTQPPTPAQGYVYDGISLAIESIKKFGPNSEAIRLGFNGLTYQGLTRNVEFDGLGNRILD